MEQREEGATTIYYDMAMSKNLVFHGRTKYIELQHHFIKDMAQKGKMRLEFF